MKVIEGDFSARGARFGVVAARFNDLITERLLEAALDALRRHGVDDQNIEVVRVPGAFEIPLAAQRMAASGRVDALVALGCIIRGATPHFDYVAGECVKGLGQVTLQHAIPVGFGILTVETIEQAIERAGTKAGNKGSDAAMAALEMVSLLKKIPTS